MRITPRPLPAFALCCAVLFVTTGFKTPWKQYKDTNDELSRRRAEKAEQVLVDTLKRHPEILGHWLWNGLSDWRVTSGAGGGGAFAVILKLWWDERKKRIGLSKASHGKSY